MKYCPECGGELRDEAMFCKHCGKVLDDQDGAGAPTPPKKNNDMTKKIVAAVLALVLLAGGVITWRVLKRDDNGLEVTSEVVSDTVTDINGNPETVVVTEEGGEAVTDKNGEPETELVTETKTITKVENSTTKKNSKESTTKTTTKKNTKESTTKKSSSKSTTKKSSSNTCDHDWEYHASMGHYETKLIEEEYDETIVVDSGYRCKGCGKKFSVNTYGSANAAANAVADHNACYCKSGYVTYHDKKTIHHEAVTENQYVDDFPAYYKCKKCGAEKDA